MISGQIQELLGKASKSFLQSTRKQSPDQLVGQADTALAKFGIFTETTVDRRSLEVTPGADEDAPPTVVIVISATVAFIAPDGSRSTVRGIGRGTGDLQNATLDAADDACWRAIKSVMYSCDDDLFSEMLAGPGDSPVS